MQKIAYILSPEGRASDVRFVPPDYVLETGEVEMAGDRLPGIDELHGPAYLLSARRAEAAREIDGAAEAARLRYITGGAGQALTYQRKYEQAYRYRDASYPSANLADYPLVKAEKDATGETGKVAADAILAKAAEWEALAAAIELERRRAKLAVAAATDVAAIEAVRDPALEALAAI